MAAVTTTLLYASLALAAIGTGVSVYGQYQQGKTAEAASEYNAKLAQREAQNTEMEAAEQIRRQRERNRRAMAEIRASQAASGLLTTEGAPLEILGQSSANFELGIQDAARRASMQAASYRSQGNMGLWEGQQAATAGTIGAIGTGLSGVGQLASGYLRTKTI